MIATDTIEFLGGATNLGPEVTSELDLAREAVKGLPSAKLDQVLRTLQLAGIPQHAVYALVGSAGTLQRRRKEHCCLSRDESDKRARLARLAVRAVVVFGSAEKGYRWLGRHNRALDGQRPLDLLATDVGAKVVADVLGRVEDGAIG